MGNLSLGNRFNSFYRKNEAETDRLDLNRLIVLLGQREASVFPWDEGWAYLEGLWRTYTHTWVATRKLLYFLRFDQEQTRLLSISRHSVSAGADERLGWS